MSTEQPPRDFGDSVRAAEPSGRSGTDLPGALTPAAPVRVAAVIPVFGGGYLTQALQSVLRQTRLPDEIIVVDDGSPDRAEVVTTVASFGDRVRLIEQSNLGAAAARNRGMAATDAEFVALLDA